MSKIVLKEVNPTNGRKVPKFLLTYEEACFSLGISMSTLLRWIAGEKIKKMEIEGVKRIKVKDLERFTDDL